MGHCGVLPLQGKGAGGVVSPTFITILGHCPNGMCCYGSTGPSVDLCVSEMKSTVGITPGLVSGVESRGSGV